LGCAGEEDVLQFHLLLKREGYPFSSRKVKKGGNGRLRQEGEFERRRRLKRNRGDHVSLLTKKKERGTISPAKGGKERGAISGKEKKRRERKGRLNCKNSFIVWGWGRLDHSDRK